MPATTLPAGQEISRYKDTEYSNEIIIDNIENNSYNDKVYKLNIIADYILKSLGHSISEVDTKLAEQQALNKMNKT